MDVVFPHGTFLALRRWNVQVVPAHCCPVSRARAEQHGRTRNQDAPIREYDLIDHPGEKQVALWTKELVGVTDELQLVVVLAFALQSVGLATILDAYSHKRKVELHRIRQAKKPTCSGRITQISIPCARHSQAHLLLLPSISSELLHLEP